LSDRDFHCDVSPTGLYCAATPAQADIAKSCLFVEHPVLLSRSLATLAPTAEPLSLLRHQVGPSAILAAVVFVNNCYLWG
jgi:hypothetical protein